MMLTDYYCFARLASKSKKRLDCIYSTHSYPAFERGRAEKEKKASPKYDATRAGALVIYYGDVPPTFRADVRRKADKSLTLKGKNISSVFVPDAGSGYGYGDFKGTPDALLLVFRDFSVTDGRIDAGSRLEVFIARRRGYDRVSLYNWFADGGLRKEMEELRISATPD